MWSSFKIYVQSMSKVWGLIQQHFRFSVPIYICDRNASWLFVCTLASKEMPEFYIGVLMIFSAIALTSQSEKLKQHKLDEKQQQRKHLCANNTYKNVRSPPLRPLRQKKRGIADFYMAARDFHEFHAGNYDRRTSGGRPFEATTMLPKH